MNETQSRLCAHRGCKEIAQRYEAADGTICWFCERHAHEHGFCWRCGCDVDSDPDNWFVIGTGLCVFCHDALRTMGGEDDNQHMGPGHWNNAWEECFGSGAVDDTAMDNPNMRGLDDIPC